jgi:cyclin T
MTDADKNALRRKPKWYLTKEELLRIPSIKDGIEPALELKMRQQAASFIQDMGDRLNYGIRDNRARCTQLCMCAAMIYMHRFFVIHSFRRFEHKDVAAACLFLAGKSEECPRKLEHIVRTWYSLKFNTEERLMEREMVEEASDYLVLLESVILQTIAFDLSVNVPHPLVLKGMNDLGMQSDDKLMKTAFHFATDLLHLTNWCVRYPVATLACFCIQLACTWAESKIQRKDTEVPWFEKIDKEMTEALLLELTDEFTGIYKECEQSNKLAIKRFADKIKTPFAPPSSSKSFSSSPSMSLTSPLPPPPPPPPSLPPILPDKPTIKEEIKVEPRKVGLNEYRERRIQASSSLTSITTTSSSSVIRQSFIPDTSKPMDGGMLEVTLPEGISLGKSSPTSGRLKFEVKPDPDIVKRSPQRSHKHDRYSRNDDRSRSNHKSRPHHSRSRSRSRPPRPSSGDIPRSPTSPPPLLKPKSERKDLEEGEVD